MQTMQRNAAKKDALLRAQRMRMLNQQQDSHRISYSQHSPKLYQAYHLPARFVIYIFKINVKRCFINFFIQRLVCFIKLFIQRMSNWKKYNLLFSIVVIYLLRSETLYRCTNIYYVCFI